ncbi:YebC/PmpR family DNA-binding transcriptional regulator [Spirulina subsalsa]|uniref:YebC/PmpR family DNA-binding transcriptional regulator n=1 Tax=Spirulina subsalsa TaxID=54311 RepID=UPI0002D7076C|nr:YebC/PmpR family DNA-binding transcriptional regulator [Spirulina subsalsa]
MSDLESLQKTLQEQDFPVKEVELRWITNTTVEVTDPEQMRSLLKLMDALESLDDVQNVTANFELNEDCLTAASLA